jgi:hypothetical protein
MTVKAYKFPNPIKYEEFQLKDFQGVDFTTHESEVNTRRSPDCKNMIVGSQGGIEKRRGSHIDHDFGAANKIWCVKHTTVSGTMYSASRVINVTFVQAGTKMWYYDDYNTTWTIVKHIVTGSRELTLQAKKSNIITFASQSNYLLVQGNHETAADDMIIIHCYASANALYVRYENSYDNGYLSVAGKGYIPTTKIACNPAGLGTSYEAKNTLTNYYINRFLSDGSSVNYYLDSTTGVYTPTDHWAIHQMQPDGSFSTTLHGAGGTGDTMTASYDAANNRVVFNKVPHATYSTGVDNIKICYMKDSAPKTYGSQINGYTQYGFFGLNGARNYIFFCNVTSGIGGNYERWLKVTDSISGTTSELYMGEYDYAFLGTNNKIGYSMYGDYMVVHCEKNNIEPTMYLRSCQLDDDNEVIFPNKPSISGLGAIAGNSFANLRDDPLWLSEAGVSAITTASFTNVQSTQDRGFYINPQLLSETNVANAIAFVYDSKYFICINSHIYIADYRYRSSEKKSASESYQYDWFYWDNMDVQCYSIKNNVLYFGTTDGKFCHLKVSGENNEYSDELVTSATSFSAGTLYHVNDVVYDPAHTEDKYVCIKEHQGIGIYLDNTTYWNSCAYVTDRYMIPVIAYWTTPILNMGDITRRKTLKNLWARFAKYPNTGCRIYYSTQGIVKERYDGYFDFSNVDFSRFTFSMDTDPMVVVTNRAERKFMSISFKIESRESYPMSVLEIVGKYTINSQYRG